MQEMTTNPNKETMLKSKNSWYLKTGQTHHFLCGCGQVDACTDAIILTIHHPDHWCSKCTNTHYLDSVMLLTNPRVTRWSIVNWDTEKIKSEGKWVVMAYAFIPVFNYTLQKIEYRKRILATNTLHFTGEHSYEEYDPMIINKYVYNHAQKASLIKDLVAQELEERLFTFVLSAPNETIAWMDHEKMHKMPAQEGIKLLSFFLEHQHLKEDDFFYWDDFEMLQEISKDYPSLKEMLFYISNNRKEKNIKKAYFESYERSMKTRNRYSYKADYLFARHIDDRNFLLKLIKIDPPIKYLLFDEVELITVGNFFAFIKERYTQKAVTKLFTEVDKQTFRYNNIVRDTLWMFRGMSVDYIQEHFRKVPLNFSRLHDELILINTLRKASLNGKIAFEYHDNDLKAQIQNELFEFRLPKTILVLQQWAQQLSNCMFGYSAAIHQGQSIIYGVFKDGVLTYAIEIKNNKIIQALGKHNKPIESEDRAEIDSWFKDTYIDSWIRPLGDSSGS